MSESRFYHISRDGKVVPVDSVSDVLAAVKGGGTMWLDFYQPTKSELMALVDPLGLHPLAIEDCTDDNQVSKIEDFDHNTFILFNALSYADRKLSVDEVGLFIGDNFLVTISGHASEARRPLADIDRVVAREIENARKGPAFLMHVILDHVVDHKAAAIEALEDELDAAEETMMADPSGFDPSDLLRLRRDLLNLRKSFFHEREILVKICRKDCRFIQDKAIVHYRDIYDHLSKFLELTEAYREIVTTLMEIYLSLLNNRMAKTANDTNATVRRLTFITTIFMPLTLLAGIGGMSEWSMMTGPDNWKIAYPFFMIAMGVIGVASYHWLKRIDRNSRSQPGE